MKELDPLCASVTFYDLNMKKLYLMEEVLMGEQRVRDWVGTLGGKHDHTT